jgi:hypothetical protein
MNGRIKANSVSVLPRCRLTALHRQALRASLRHSHNRLPARSKRHWQSRVSEQGSNIGCRIHLQEDESVPRRATPRRATDEICRRIRASALIGRRYIDARHLRRVLLCGLRDADQIFRIRQTLRSILHACARRARNLDAVVGVSPNLDRADQKQQQHRRHQCDFHDALPTLRRQVRWNPRVFSRTDSSTQFHCTSTAPFTGEPSGRDE